MVGRFFISFFSFQQKRLCLYAVITWV